RQAVRRRQQVRDALREGPDAARQRLLVADDVRRRLLLRRECAQPLHAEPAQRAKKERGRLDRSLPSGRESRPGQGVQLAASCEGSFYPNAAPLLAQGEAALDPRRQLEAAGG